MYNFIMFLATIVFLAGIVLLPYFIYLKVKNQQPKIFPEILSHKKRVGGILLGTFFALGAISGTTPEYQAKIEEQNKQAPLVQQEQQKKQEISLKNIEEESRKQEAARKIEEVAGLNEETKKSGTFKVIETIDGDTLAIDYQGKREKVRLVGIDTPETKHQSKPIQCFGQEASTKLKELVEGKNIFIEFDPTQNQRDKYGRLLLYIFNEAGQNIAREMIIAGYGHEYTYNSNPHKYQKQFKEAEKSARENKRGLWADNTCAGNTEKPAAPAPQPTPTPAPAPAPQPQYVAPHPAPRPAPAPAPTPTYQQNTSVYYKNCREAREAGVVPLYAGQPGYRSGLDGDGDGIACEPFRKRR